MPNLNTKKPIRLLEHNKRVILNALSPLNRWGTGEEIGHDPDPTNTDDMNALVEHFITWGGLAWLEDVDHFPA